MRIQSVFSEAWRNLFFGTAKPALFASLVAVIASVLGILDVSAIARVDDVAQQFQAAAANIRGIAAEGRIDPTACDALGGTPSIAAAGGLSIGEPLLLDASPLTQLHTYRVTPGFGALIGVDPDTTGGVWVEAGLASALGLQVGTIMPTEHDELTVTALYEWPNDGRDARLSFTILIPESSVRLLDECWMSSWPVLPANDDLLRNVALVAPGSQASMPVVQLNKSFGVAYNANEEFAARVTAEIRWIALLAGLAVGVVAVLRRRIEYAAALHAGQDRVSHLLTVVLETMVWAGAGTILGSVACLFAAQLSGVNDWLTTWLVVVRSPLLAFVGALCGVIAGSFVIKERLLFHYFRQR